MKVMRTLGCAALAALGFSAIAGAAEAPKIRLAGGTTWSKLLTADKVAKFEEACKVKLEVDGTGSARGMKELMGGSAQICMVAGSLDVIVKQVNEKDPGTVKQSDLAYVPVTKQYSVVVANAGNPVSKLTLKQARALFSGQTKNWKEVGGADLPVQVVLASKGEGARLEVQKQLLDWGSFAADAKEMNKATEVPEEVAKTPGAIGSMPATHQQAGVKVIDIGMKISLPLGLATKGAATKEQKCVIEAIKKSEGSK